MIRLKCYVHKIWYTTNKCYNEGDIQTQNTRNIQNTDRGKMCLPGDQDK